MARVFSQLCSYDFVPWLAFVTITAAASYLGRGLGIVVGHFAVACTVLWLDFQWIQSEMNAPGWNGTPDMDIISHIGVFLRAVLINAVLLPIALLCRWLSLRQTKAKPQPVA
jgi:hypothetical protein